jgi:4'-phosphopantetheinyl transferase
MLFDESAIDIWTLNLLASNEQIESAYQLLSSDERQRAERFHFPADRRRFVIRRAGLRQILGQYLDVAPSSLMFCYSENGKPGLASPHPALRFNLSHSRELALVACSTSREIGVDVEWIRSDLEIEDLAQRFFSPAENELLKVVHQDQKHLAFLSCWTCKEACLKAIGKGLSLDPRTIDVSAVFNNVPTQTGGIQKFLSAGFAVAVMETQREGYLSALAVEPGDFTLKIHPASEFRTDVSRTP